MAGTRHKFKTTNIKGKEYVEVNERIKFFREDGAYNGWSLTSDVIEHSGGAIIIKAVIRNSEGVEVSSGLAREVDGSTFINKTSYVENCETSAWGRALANLGIGIDTSVASSNEVENAILQQDTMPKKKVLTKDIYDRMSKAISDGGSELVNDSLSQFEEGELKELIIKELNG